MNSEIKITGACANNLKNISVTIPKNKLTVITGVSGSGKSSLAFDIIAEEGKRRYMSLIDPWCSYDKVDNFVSISNLSPTVTVKQRTGRLTNSRSTVATKTGLDKLLAMLFVEVGVQCGSLSATKEKKLEHFQRYSPKWGMCPECKGCGKKYIVDEKLLFSDAKMELHKVLGKRSTQYQALYLFCQNNNLAFNQSIGTLSEDALIKYKYGDKKTKQYAGIIPWVIDLYKKESKLKSFEESEFPFVSHIDCPNCLGSGRGEIALKTTINGKNIVELEDMELCELQNFLNKGTIESRLISEIIRRINVLQDVNLGYLEASRSMVTLSGGEAQRLDLANYLCSDIDSLVFVFDEPTIGLHENEKATIATMLRQLVAKGNTVIVVEHDSRIISSADYVIEIGPGAGSNGGKVIYQGDIIGYVANHDSSIAKQLRNISCAKKLCDQRKYDIQKSIHLYDCKVNNLKDIAVSFPLGCLIGVAGMSGSGKSSLIGDTLVPLIQRELSAKEILKDKDLSGCIRGCEGIKKCVFVEQKPFGANQSSLVATFLDIFDEIRGYFSASSGLSAGLFSPNSTGACPSCHGEGVIHYGYSKESLLDFECGDCQGSGFNMQALSVYIDGHNIKDILDMQCVDACDFFMHRSKTVYKKLCYMRKVGLGYLKLGQRTTTLSGGESQRLKIARQLNGKKNNQATIYILDEPTSGLSCYDVECLIEVLNDFVNSGDTVIIIEHDIYALSNCDYIIELGPGGGKSGGNIIARGSPNEVKENKLSLIGKFF